MPLALVVDTLESVPEALRGAYVADGDKFKLDAEIEDTTGLKATVAATRRERDAANAQAKEWRALGKSPAEIAAMLENQAALEAEAAKKRGDFDGILKQHTDKWTAKEAELTARADTALGVARAATVDAGIKSALATAKATATGIKTLPRILGERVKTEFVDGAFVTTIVQTDGKTPMIGSGANGTATYDDLMKEAVKEYPDLFEGTGAGGGGTPSKGGGGSGAKTVTRKEWEALSPTDQRAKHKDGFKVVE